LRQYAETGVVNGTSELSMNTPWW